MIILDKFFDLAYFADNDHSEGGAHVVQIH